MDNKSAIRILERELAIKAWLKELIEVKGAKLPIIPETIYEALENIDSDIAIKEFEPDTEELQNLINEKKAQTLVYEWFYDGGEANNIYVEGGTAYTSCIFDGKPGQTDLLKLENNEGFEMDPKFDGLIEHAVDHFCLDPVMNVWYETLSPKFNGLHNEYWDLNNASVDLDEVSTSYEELFHLKLISLIRESYIKALQENPIKITMEAPFHLFIKRHERWPMHVLSLKAIVDAELNR